MKIETKSYELIGILDDEQDMLESLSEKSGYICDAISETADNYIPIYTHEVWENASALQEHIEEAISSGLAGVEGNNIDLVKIFQAGYYQYYTQSLYDNLDILIFNYLAEGINEKLKNVSENTLKRIDFEALNDEIENEASGYDNNNTFDDLEDTVNDIFEQLENGVFDK